MSEGLGRTCVIFVAATQLRCSGKVLLASGSSNAPQIARQKACTEAGGGQILLNGPGVQITVGSSMRRSLPERGVPSSQLCLSRYHPTSQLCLSRYHPTQRRDQRRRGGHDKEREREGERERERYHFNPGICFLAGEFDSRNEFFNHINIAYIALAQHEETATDLQRR